MFVPVTSQTGQKLMPTRANKAGMLNKKGLATPIGLMVYSVSGLTMLPKTNTHKI